MEHNREKNSLFIKRNAVKDTQKKNGHRQGYSLLKVNKLQMPIQKKKRKIILQKILKSHFQRKVGQNNGT
ncbi:MAG: hypothetical protein Ct9H300mP23_06140 [Nitrospinota bacterium]|nr:MAG: hypothetical protein Ct9H300mP23_06140 [Nitrospinota bacterium]